MSRTVTVGFRAGRFWAHDVSLSLLLAETVRVADAGRRLRRRGSITRAEASRWQVLDDEAVIWRGADAVDTAPIAELGDAIVELVRGTLPSPPPGTWWFFGVDDGPRTIGVAPEAPTPRAW
jgi:hypothetical protein